jgi:phosphoribosyl-ATP pyrophosphohydrolase/phosphoribosyl-AMP cyclohydrolase
MNIDFSKNTDGLIPAIIQDSETNAVLMLGYMNAEAYQKTIDTKKVTFIADQNKGFGQRRGKRQFLNLIDIKMTVTMIL